MTAPRFECCLVNSAAPTYPQKSLARSQPICAAWASALTSGGGDGLPRCARNDGLISLGVGRRSAGRALALVGGGGHGDVGAGW